MVIFLELLGLYIFSFVSFLELGIGYLNFEGFVIELCRGWEFRYRIRGFIDFYENRVFLR